MSETQTLEQITERRDALAAQIIGLNSDLKAMNLRIAVMKAEYKIGDRVIRYGKDEYEIVNITSGWCMYSGKRVLKSGELGKRVFELYGNLKKVVES